MRTLYGLSGALAALVLVAPIAATAQVPRGAITDAPGSDRAGKLLRADTPPADPAPAPGSRLGRDTPAPGARLTPDAANVAETRANAAAAPGVVPPPVIGSHQIDRYDAIARLQKSVQEDPKALSDWIILGELAHEVAMDVPADAAGKYFKLSRDAYESALALAPTNAGLKAAVQFARDQEKNAETFEKSRDAYTDTFLNARRRDLVATGNTPYVKMYEPILPDRRMPGANPTLTANADVAADPSLAANPTVIANGLPASGSTENRTPAPATPAAVAAQIRATSDRNVDASVPLTRTGDTPVAEASAAVTPAPTTAPATDAANYGTRQNYSATGTLAAQPTQYAGPRYRPYATVGGSPYTYEQYSTNFFPGVVNANPAVQPVTSQRYSAPIAPNTFERQILNRAPATAPATTPAPGRNLP